ncbi:MAG: hypothetical protein AVDCRST_MAG53-2020, partial [uncultured Solirubrobacteraceae bacterium]
WTTQRDQRTVELIFDGTARAIHGGVCSIPPMRANRAHSAAAWARRARGDGPAELICGRPPRRSDR